MIILFNVISHQHIHVIAPSSTIWVINNPNNNLLKWFLPGILSNKCLVSRYWPGLALKTTWYIFYIGTRLSQSPSLLISASGSWPPREGLLSPAENLQEELSSCKFIQSRTVLLMRRQSNPITRHETWLELFWSNFKWTVFSLRAVFRCRFIAHIQIQI